MRVTAIRVDPEGVVPPAQGEAETAQPWVFGMDRSGPALKGPFMLLWGLGIEQRWCGKRIFWIAVDGSLPQLLRRVGPMRAVIKQCEWRHGARKGLRGSG